LDFNTDGVAGQSFGTLAPLASGLQAAVEGEFE
jgi:hypothetical protein